MTPDIQNALLGCLPAPPGMAGPTQAPPFGPVPGAASQVSAAGPLGPGRYGLAYVTPVPIGGGGFVQVISGSPGFTKVDGPSYDAGPGANSVLLADFNGDGNLDIAVVNRGAVPSPLQGSVSIYLGKGDGTFQSRINSLTGRGSDSITAGDFNGDGKLDLAVANAGSNDVTILLGLGNGSFRAPVNIPVGNGPTSVMTADFNADGKADLAVTNGGSNTVSILLGRGDGSFQTPVDYAAGNGPSYVAAGDFNDDGKLDLAVANHDDGTVSIRMGIGNGAFGPLVHYLVSRNPGSLILTDFNFDGRLDVVVGIGNPRALGPDMTYGFGPADPSSGAMAVLLGYGDGTFQGAASFPTDRFPQSVAAADFNGDGLRDLAVANGFGQNVTVLLGTGNTFRAGSTIDIPTDAPAQLGPVSIVSGDFNGDGNADLAIANKHTGSVLVALGNGDGTFQQPVSYPGFTSANFITTADFDGDGVLDLAVASALITTQPNVAILLGNGDGTFRAGGGFNSGNFPFALAVADFDGDGKPDLAVANAGVLPGVPFPPDAGNIAIAINQGDGTFSVQAKYTVGTNPEFVAAGDLNGDGKPDLAILSNPGPTGLSLTLLPGNGDGTFQLPASRVLPAGGFAGWATVTDLNGDGNNDLVIAGLRSGISYFPGNGDGTFHPAVQFATGGFPGMGAIADFNADGNPDVAIVNTPPGGTGAVTVLINAAPAK